MNTIVEKIKDKLAASLVLATLVIGIGIGVFAQDDGNSVIYLPAMANSAIEDGSSSTLSPDLSGDAQISDDPYEVTKQRAIDLLVADEEMTLYLANHPGWVADAWQNEEGADVWHVNFTIPAPNEESSEEWLGDGEVNVVSGEVLWAYAPRELTAEEFQTGLQMVETLVGRDPEVQAMLGDPDLWEHETYYNRWEQYWETSYWHGLDVITVRTNVDDENAYIDSIYDPNEFEAEEQELLQRNQAIELAYEADGIDLALDNVDNWRTYVEAQGGSQYTVEFVSEGQQLFYALVDIETWAVVSTE